MSADRRKKQNTPGCTHHLQLVTNKVITVIANRKLEVGDSGNEFEQIKAHLCGANVTFGGEIGLG